MMLHRIPLWFQRLFPGYIWQLPNQEKVIYLTFDDGPIPGVTEWVIDVLDQFDVKASFFVVGENVNKHPQVFKKLIDHGHLIGNHTFHHVRGWRTSTQEYIKEVERCNQSIIDNGGEITGYFRPPHGRIKPGQAKELRNQYKLLMWSVLTVDYDRNLNEKTCLSNSIKATSSGSIVVFHDSIKAEKNLRYVLPRYIEHFLKEGYSFQRLP